MAKLTKDQSGWDVLLYPSPNLKGPSLLSSRDTQLHLGSSSTDETYCRRVKVSPVTWHYILWEEGNLCAHPPIEQVHQSQWQLHWIVVQVACIRFYLYSKKYVGLLFVPSFSDTVPMINLQCNYLVP